MKRLLNPLLEEMRFGCYLKALCFELTENQFVYLVQFKFLLVTVYFFTNAKGDYILRPSISKVLDRKKKANTLYNFCKDTYEVNPWILFPECNLAKIITTGAALAKSTQPKKTTELSISAN